MKGRAAMMTEEEQQAVDVLVRGSKELHARHLAYQHVLESELDFAMEAIRHLMWDHLLLTVGWLGLVLNALFLRAWVLSAALVVYFVVFLIWQARRERRRRRDQARVRQAYVSSEASP
jgi:thiosulfate reductase cytochrome b subunit